MVHFIFNKADLRYLFLKYDNEDDYKSLKKLKEHINLVNPICYLPTYSGLPYTEDFIFEYIQPSGTRILYCAIGLWQVIYMFFRDNKIEFDGLFENSSLFKIKLQHTYEEFKAIVDSWELKYKPREYQYKAAYNILQWKQSTSQLATRAGKTLIAYMIFRYEIEYMGMKKILMIVPSIDLVKQAYNDFNEYKEFFKTECIWSGGKIVNSANITIGTFQSLIKFLDTTSKKYNPHFFDGYDCVFVDETHRASAKQITTIISQPFVKNVKIMFGMTGTLPKEKTIEHYCIHALLGAKIQEINPRELMDAGYISDIEINQIRLKYFNDSTIEKTKDIYIKCAEYALGDYVEVKDEKHEHKMKKVKLPEDKSENLIQYSKTLPFIVEDVKSKVKLEVGDNPKAYKIKYINALKKIISVSPKTNSLVIECMMVHFLDERILYLCTDVLPKCFNNTLILAHYTEYIYRFSEVVKRYFPNRHIAVITGSVSAKKRDKIKNMLKEHNDCILIASYGVMSTGITLSNLCFGVLFESFKSNIINMQSLGRGLGLSAMKDKYVVYDFVDMFSPLYFSKQIYLQGLAKTKIYKENKYKYNIIEKTL